MNDNRMIDCIFKADRSQSELTELIAHIKNASRLSGDADIVAQFELALANYFGVTYAIAVSSGTAALHATLMETIQSGDEVLLPVIGVPMTAAAIIEAGGVPVFYDASPGSFAPDLETLLQMVSVKTKALITVPMWGYSAFDDALRVFAVERGLVIIEDTAQALGTMVDGKFEGTRGHVGCFSTHEFKLLSTGEGGFVLTNDAYHAKRIRSFTHIGFSMDEMGFGHRSGLNYKLSALQAALGLSQLSRLDEKIRERQEKIALWIHLLGVAPGARLTQFGGAGDRHNGYSLALTLADAPPGEARKVAQRLFDAGVNTDIYRYQQSYIVNYPMLRRFYNDPRYTGDCIRDFPNATRIIDSLIVLPCHDQISFTDIDVAACRLHAILA